MYVALGCYCLEYIMLHIHAVRNYIPKCQTSSTISITF